MKYGSGDRKGKIIGRAETSSLLVPKNSILAVPSDSALCCKSMEDHHVIDKDTRQQWVECKKGIYNKLGKLAESYEYTNVTTHHTYLEDYIPDTKVDLVHADMETSFTERLGLAFENNLSPMFLPNTDIVMCVSAWARNIHTIDFRNWMTDQARKEGILRDYADYICQHFFEDNYDRREELVMPVLLLSCALYQFNCQRIRKIASYKDRKMRMVLFSISDINRITDPILPSLSSLISEFKEHHEPKFVSRREMELEEKIRLHFSKIGINFHTNGNLWVGLESDGFQRVQFRNLDEAADFISRM